MIRSSSPLLSPPPPLSFFSSLLFLSVSFVYTIVTLQLSLFLNVIVRVDVQIKSRLSYTESATTH